MTSRDTNEIKRRAEIAKAVADQRGDGMFSPGEVRKVLYGELKISDIQPKNKGRKPNVRSRSHNGRVH